MLHFLVLSRCLSHSLQMDDLRLEYRSRWRIGSRRVVKQAEAAAGELDLPDGDSKKRYVRDLHPGRCGSRVVAIVISGLTSQRNLIQLARKPPVVRDQNGQKLSRAISAPAPLGQRSDR